MTVKPLEEDFRRMGLSPNEIRESLHNMGGAASEAGVLGEDTEENFEEDAYLSDLVDDDEDSEEQDEAVTRQRTKKSTAAEKRKSRQYYAQHKGQISRKGKVRRKKSGYKRHQAKLAAAPKGGPRTRRMVSDRENPGDGMDSMHESLMGELSELAESIEREPVSRFQEYVEAFNHIADLGEMAAMQVMDEDEEAAAELLKLSLQAEAMLKEMEEMGGALDSDEDEYLEEALADAMEDVGTTFEEYGFLAEDEEDSEEDEEEIDEEEDFEEDVDEDEEENPFLEAAREMREARGTPSKKRKILNPKSPKTVSGQSAWGKANKGKGASKKQLARRGDVDNVQALLGYLKKVKQGKVAPGQPQRMTKKGGNVRKLNKGARAAMAAAGK